MDLPGWLGPLVIPSQIIGINRPTVNATIGGALRAGVRGRWSGPERPDIAPMIAVSTSPTIKLALPRPYPPRIAPIATRGRFGR